MKKHALALPLAAAVFASAAGPALAAVRTVDDDKVQCPSAQFTTIQSAVDAANPGDSIQVCNGLYREQVDIAKNNIDLLSKVVRGATISPPAGDLAEPRALVHITGSNDKVRRFRIVGPGTGINESLRFGVLVDGQANKVGAQVLDNLIADIRDTQPAATSTGIGVKVGSFFNNVSSPGRAAVLRNEITRYQTAGVVVNETGSFATVGSNTIRGLGLITDSGNNAPPPAQTGIQIGYDAAADVNTNTVTENKYSGDSGEAGIGIDVIFNPTAKDPRGSTPSRVKGNKISNNDVGLLLYDARNWLIETNVVQGNGDPSTAAPDGGISVGESGAPNGNGNRLNRNDARGNAGLDCEDTTNGPGTAGTGNTWTRNRGSDASPAAICTESGNPAPVQQAR